MTTTTATPALEGLVPLQERPAYTAAKAKLDRVSSQLRDAKRELATLRAHRRAELQSDDGATPHDRGKLLLAGGSVAPRGPALVDRIEELAGQVEDLIQAQRLGREEVQSVRGRLSVAAVAEVAAAYRAHGERVGRALATLVALVGEERQLRAAFAAAGFEAYRLPGLNLPQLEGQAKAWAQRARKAGLRIEGLD